MLCLHFRQVPECLSDHRLSGDVRRHAKERSRFSLNLAFNYGSRQEIVQAVRRIVEAGVSPENLRGQEGEALFERYLWSAGLPDPDLIIRTAGEMRLSNFLLWQSAYSEFWSTPVLWPDFDAEALQAALLDYQGRQRRFGGVQNGVEALP